MYIELSASKVDDQAVAGQAVTLNVPGMSRDLGLTQLQGQWVCLDDLMTSTVGMER